MNTLLTFILLWICGVAAVFLIKIYKTLLATPDASQSKPATETETIDDDIMGETRPQTSHQSLPSPPAPETPAQQSSPSEVLEDKGKDVTDEYLISGYQPDQSPNARMAQQCLDDMPEHDGVDNHTDGCSLDEIDSLRETMTAKNEEFEQVILDREKLSKLLKTHSKLDGSVYYNKLKENQAVQERAKHISNFAKQLFVESFQKLGSEETAKE